MDKGLIALCFRGVFHLCLRCVALRAAARYLAGIKQKRYLIQSHRSGVPPSFSSTDPWPLREYLMVGRVDLSSRVCRCFFLKCSIWERSVSARVSLS